MSAENLSARLAELESILDRARKRFEEGMKIVEDAHRAFGDIQQALLGAPASGMSVEDSEEAASRLLASLKASGTDMPETLCGRHGVRADPEANAFFLQSDRAVPRPAPQVAHHFGMVRQLASIAALELAPALRFVAEPGPQLAAGGDVFHPLVDPQCRFAHSARPQPVNQDALAIAR